MFENYLSVINPIIALSINIVIQILSMRYVIKGLLRSMFLGFAIGLLCLLIVGFFLVFRNIEYLPDLMINIIIYFSLGYCYFHFLNLGETARRIRIIRELHDSNGGLTLEEILKRYNASKIIDLRLQRMISKGQVIYRKDRYYIGKPIMLWITQIIIMMKLILLKKRGEFE